MKLSPDVGKNLCSPDAKKSLSMSNNVKQRRAKVFNSLTKMYIFATRAFVGNEMYEETSLMHRSNVILEIYSPSQF